MSNASIDENGVRTLLGVDSSNGSSVVKIQATSSNRLATSDGTGGSDLGPSNAKRDENSTPTLLAVSSTDGVTPVVVYSDSNGNLLTQST